MCVRVYVCLCVYECVFVWVNEIWRYDKNLNGAENQIVLLHYKNSFNKMSVFISHLMKFEQNRLRTMLLSSLSLSLSLSLSIYIYINWYIML